VASFTADPANNAINVTLVDHTRTRRIRPGQRDVLAGPGGDAKAPNQPPYTRAKGSSTWSSLLLYCCRSLFFGLWFC